MVEGRFKFNYIVVSCLADTKGLEPAAPAGQGNFTAEHVIARGKMIKNLRALDG